MLISERMADFLLVKERGIALCVWWDEGMVVWDLMVASRGVWALQLDWLVGRIVCGVHLVLSTRVSEVWSAVKRVQEPEQCWWTGESVCLS